MTSLTQKYTLVQLLQPMPEGTEYVPSEWPLHVTLVDIFAVDDIDSLIEQLYSLHLKRDTIFATARQDEYFGSQQETRVTILEMSDELLALHSKLVTVLKRAGATFNNPQYIEAGFRAHASVRPQARLEPGDRVAFNELTIIDMFPSHNPNLRKILKTIPLSADE